LSQLTPHVIVRALAYGSARPQPPLRRCFASLFFAWTTFPLMHTSALLLYSSPCFPFHRYLSTYPLQLSFFLPGLTPLTSPLSSISLGLGVNASILPCRFLLVASVRGSDFASFVSSFFKLPSIVLYFFFVLTAGVLRTDAVSTVFPFSSNLSVPLSGISMSWFPVLWQNTPFYTALGDAQIGWVCLSFGSYSLHSVGPFHGTLPPFLPTASSVGVLIFNRMTLFGFHSLTRPIKTFPLSAAVCWVMGGFSPPPFSFLPTLVFFF